MQNPIYWIIGIVIFIFLVIVYIYNRLITLAQRVKEAESDIDVQLKRRADLIPNLVETVKGYASHEKEVFERVTQARSVLLSAKNIKEEIEADNMLTSALKTLFAVAENYPELKANQNFLELQRELRDAEDKIMASRRFYNAVVMEYNSFLQQFPNNLIANIFKFKPYEYFEIEVEAEKEVPKVKF
ncbi:MAG: LemA family protein [Nitrososphaerota archaeon]